MITTLVFLTAAISLSHQNAITYTHWRGRQVLNLAAGAYSSDPIRCVRWTYPHSHYIMMGHWIVPCDGQNNTCAMYVAMSTTEEQIIVGFRGTTTNEQLLLEFDESLEPNQEWYGTGTVNRYFKKALDFLWPHLLPILEQSSSANYRVLFTGHSLGGALAVLAASKTHMERLRKPEQVSLFTYGEPRVGNRHFAHSLMQAVGETWRVIHRKDLVPHLPPCRDKGAGCDETDDRRVYHHGIEIWYPNGMTGATTFKACTDSMEDPNCSNKLSTDYEWEDHRWYYGVYVSKHGKYEFCEKEFPTHENSGAISSHFMAFVAVFTFIFLY